jgi:DNA polymerase III epsilon subunit-like protein
VHAVDVETTGTDPGRHHAWDIAVVEPDGARHQWFVKPDLGTADPHALKVGQFYRRTAGLLAPLARRQGPKWSDPAKAAVEIAVLLDGAVLLGHNPPFDAAMLAALLRRNGQVLTADHHQIDTGTLVTGFIAGVRRGYRGVTEPAVPCRWPDPKGRHLADMARAVGVDPDGYEQHTALGDALLAWDTYQAVMGGGS